jgi:hypothetical protein
VHGRVALHAVSDAAFELDHVHIISEDPRASALRCFSACCRRLTASISAFTSIACQAADLGSTPQTDAKASSTSGGEIGRLCPTADLNRRIQVADRRPRDLRHAMSES